MYIDYDFELVLGWGNVMFEIHLGIIKMALYAKHLLAGQDKHCNYAQPCSTNTASIAPLCKDRCCTQMQPLAIGDCKGAHCWPVTVASNGGGGCQCPSQPFCFLREQILCRERRLGGKESHCQGPEAESMDLHRNAGKPMRAAAPRTAPPTAGAPERYITPGPGDSGPILFATEAWAGVCVGRGDGTRHCDGESR